MYSLCLVKFRVIFVVCKFLFSAATVGEKGWIYCRGIIIIIIITEKCASEHLVLLQRVVVLVEYCLVAFKRRLFNILILITTVSGTSTITLRNPTQNPASEQQQWDRSDELASK